MSLSPFFKSPLTDFTGTVISHQYGSRCGPYELKALDCLEAYGLDKGYKVCLDLVTDFQECAIRTKEYGRYLAMRNERERQYRAGERSKEDRYAEPPKADSY